MKITLLRVLVALMLNVTFLTSVFALPAQAAPEEGGMRWKYHTVHVVYHEKPTATRYWYVTSATQRMDGLPSIRFIYHSASWDSTGSNGQIIHVRRGFLRKADGSCDYSRLAWASIWDTPDGYTYDGYISRVTVQLNDCWIRFYNKDERRHIVMHELMHGIVGVLHWKACPSVIGGGCGSKTLLYPTSVDRDKVRKWYDPYIPYP